MKQKKLIFNFFVNRNWKKLADSRKRAKILADNRKSHHPIETLISGPEFQVKMASGFLTFNKALIKKLFWVVQAKSITNLCKLSRSCSHWFFRLFLCTPYPNLGILTIIRWGCQWAKYRDLSVASRSIICLNRRLKQIIDLFYHWFDHRICFLMNIFGKRSDLPFLRKCDHKKEKSVVSFTHEQNINCSQT